MILVIPKRRIAGILPFAVVLAVGGCAGEDKRLTEDKQTCQDMGHLAGSAEFNKCLGDLNQRRCATVNRNGGGGHFASLDCARL